MSHCHRNPPNGTIFFPVFQFDEDGTYRGVWVSRLLFIARDKTNHYHEPPRGLQEMVNRICQRAPSVAR